MPSVLFQSSHFGLLFAGTIVTLLPQKPQLLGARAKSILWALLGLCVIVAVSSTYGPNPLNSMSQASLLFATVGFIWVTFEYRWTSSERISKDVSFIFWLLTSVSIIGCLGFFFGAPWSFLDFRFSGVYSNPNYAGGAAAISIAICIFPFARARTAATLGLVVFGVAIQCVSLVLSSSRGSILALTIGLIFFLLTRFRVVKLIAVIFSMGAVLSILMISPLSHRLVSFLGSAPQLLETASSGRAEIYRLLIARWLTVPLTGSGYRSTELSSGTIGVSAHNIFLQALVETGLVGFLALLAVLFLIFVAGHLRGKVSPLLWFAVTALSFELTESTLYGFGSTLTTVTWLLLMAYASLGKFPEVFFPISKRLGFDRAANPLNREIF